MPQFDLFTFSAQIFWALFFFIILYLSFIYYLIPSISTTLKVRSRKLKLQSAAQTFSSVSVSENVPLDLYVSTEIFEKKGVVLNNNSPQEILDATKEKIDRLNNNWKIKIEDEELQKKFWTLFPIDAKNKVSGKELHGKIKSRVGTEFLKQNKNFLQ